MKGELDDPDLFEMQVDEAVAKDEKTAVLKYKLIGNSHESGFGRRGHQ